MTNPTIMVVDDDAAVLAAVGRDLVRRYGENYRIARFDGGAPALEAARGMRARKEPIALFLVDQRMPVMTGVEFLSAAVQLFPDAKRVLLTAYADTEAAIRAINEVGIQHYLMKPWDPPEERLFPVLDDLLEEWRAAWRPGFGGLSVIGHRWSASGHGVKDFLARNLVPYRWLDVEVDVEAQELLREIGMPEATGPVVVFPDGTHLVEPSLLDLATKVGLKTRPELPLYDLVIVGAGPAGLAAAVYGASEGLRTVLIEGEAPGGQAGMSSRIENYLGFPSGLSGSDLARRAVAQARRFGAEILNPVTAMHVEARDPFRILRLSDGSELVGRAVLVASGVAYRKLDVPGAERLTGTGVYYGAAMTEARASAGADVFIVGAGNSAGQAAMHLAGFADSVTILARGASLVESMSQYLVTRLEETPNVCIRTRAEVRAVDGDRHIESVTILDRDAGSTQTLPAGGLFVFIGAHPRTDWTDGAIARDPKGFILTGLDMVEAYGSVPAGWRLSREPFWLETSMPGVFAAGDVRHRSVKRVATSVGEGSMAIQFVHQHLASL